MKMEESAAACAPTDDRFFGLDQNTPLVNAAAAAAAAVAASAAAPVDPMPAAPPAFLLRRGAGSPAGISPREGAAFNLPLRSALDVAMDAGLVADFATEMNSGLVRDPQMVSYDPMAAFERLYIGKEEAAKDSMKAAAMSPLMRENGAPDSPAGTTLSGPLLPGASAVSDFESAWKDSLVHGVSSAAVGNLAEEAWTSSAAGRKSRPLANFSPSMIQKPSRRSSALTFAETAMYSNFDAFASIDLEDVKNSRPKRRNVKISTEPQTVSARHRRMKISDRMRVLQRLVPGGTKMDTASMLDEAISYVKFLKDKLEKFQTVSNAAGGSFGTQHEGLIDLRSGPLYRGSPLAFHTPLPMDCATVVSQGLSSAPQKFDALCTPGCPIDTFRSSRSSFADNTYREQFCH